jgi:hypothetical protein
MPQLPLSRWNNLPIIYEGNSDLRNFVVQYDNIVETNIDIIASSFFMLSRYEELMVNEKDQFGRFPAAASIAYKENFLTRPIVNDYIDMLWEWIDGFDLGYERRTLWNGKDFAACLTHDIDHTRRWTTRSICRELVNSGDMAFRKHSPLAAIRKVAKTTISVLSLKDPYWNFDEIMALEKYYGFSSSFYVFGDGKHRKLSNYSIYDGKISRLLSEIQDKGHEVGLHGSLDSYNDLEMLREEKENLERLVGDIFSVRQHFLKLSVPDTFTIHEKLHIKCDVTLGFAEHEGFRAGCCFPFRPYNIEEDRPLDVLEIPLTVMEGTFSEAQYKGMNEAEAWQSMESVLTEVKNHRGCVVLLWHNTHLSKFEHADSAVIYEQSLKWIADSNGLGTSAKYLVESFQSNQIK